MITFPGFSILEVIHKSGKKILCRAKKDLDDSTVILKIIPNEFFDLADIAIMERELEISSKIESEGVLKLLEIVDTNQGLAMVMQNFEGILLSDYLKIKQVSFGKKLEISIQLADLVEILHRNNIIHKNINPDNFLYDPETGKIKLFEFSISILVRKEIVEINNHREIEGALEYISPEQTGRTNRMVDFKTDFYSLGVLMYRMFSGKLPFNTEDPGELVHAHIAKKPEDPCLINPSIPSVLGKIILKLLEKAPEQRYKSAKGLIWDLENCRFLHFEKGNITEFEIAKHDKSDQFYIPQKLYGREKEISELLVAIENSVQGGASFVLIGGYSGIGKSTLVNEVYQNVVTSGSFFATGKFDQFQKNIPYSAGISAFRGLVMQLLAEPNEIIESWKEKILHVLGSNAQLIIDIIPEVELIIGKQPPLIPLPATEAINRVNLAFVSFIQLFAKPEHPLVIFLDDLQWADLPTLKLINLVLNDLETSHFLLIGTYRENEVDASHPLTQLVDSLKENHCSLQEIILQPLGQENIRELLTDIFSADAPNVLSLAELILKKTGGNPFFTNEFLKSLHQEKLIRFDHESLEWDWDIKKIVDEDITDNVVELMIGKIKKLNPSTQDLCKYASCIGNSFDLMTLSKIYDKSPEDTEKSIWPAVEEGLILGLGKTSKIQEQLKLEDKSKNIQYRFLHDRVQQAAYAMVEEKEKESLHLHIGRILLESYSEDKISENIFDIVNQLNSGARLINTEEEKIKVAKLNLVAGKKAKSSAAYEPAHDYLSAGIRILPTDVWKTYTTLALELHNECGESAYLSGNIGDMEKITYAIFQNIQNPTDLIKANIIKIKAFVSLTKNEEAFDTGIECLKGLGLNFPEKPNQLHIIFSLLATKFNLRNKTKEQLLSLPEMDDEKQSNIMEILSEIAQPSYFAKKNFFPLIVFKQINLSIKHGNHHHTAFAYSTYGIVMCGSTFEFEEGLKYGELAVSLNEKFGSKALFSKIHFINGNFIRNWKFHYSKNLPGILESYHKGIETGDFLFASYAAFNYCVIKFFMDIPLPKLNEEMEDFASSLKKIKQDLGLRWLNTFRETSEILTGEKLHTQLKGKYYNEEIEKKHQEDTFDFTGLFVYTTNKVLLEFLNGNPKNVIRQAESGFKIVENVLAWPHIPFVQCLYAISLLQVAPNQGRIKKSISIFKAKQIISKIKKAADSSPENFSNKVHLVLAELYAIRKIKDKALKEYELAIQQAKESNLNLERAIANELCGIFYLSFGDKENGFKYLLEARRIFQKWGAVSKVDQMDGKYDLKAKKELNESKSEGNIPEYFLKQSVSELDMNSLMKASLAISGEILLENLVEKLMGVVVENAGAQNGYLIIQTNQEWFIEGLLSIMPEFEKPETKIPLKRNPFVPESVVQFVIRTQEDLVLDDIQQDIRFKNDPVFNQNKTISVLCLPVFNQGRLTAILYLDNSLHPGVFTEDRVKFLKLLSGQIAISLENALLYKNLEQKVMERTEELEKQKDALEHEKLKSESLLLNILPKETADELKINGTSIPKYYQNITVMFTDFVNFTQASENLDAVELVKEINYYYSVFDEIMSKHQVEKIKTIGDSYMAASGMPMEKSSHAIDAVNAALEICRFVSLEKEERISQNRPFFEIRIGLHSGPVVAGIVGTKKFVYDIWGDTVNVASRMESHGEPDKVNISGVTYELVKENFEVHFRGKIEVKNKGMIDMYFVSNN